MTATETARMIGMSLNHTLLLLRTLVDIGLISIDRTTPGRKYYYAIPSLTLAEIAATAEAKSAILRPNTQDLTP
jgi:DNA-binding IclR family transcriptional regulator